MRKIILMLAAALLIVGVVGSAEAASKLQMVRSAVPKVVETVTKTAGKVGDDISSFFWRNKASIVTGTALVTAATNPVPFVEGAVAAINGPPTVIVQNVDPKKTRTTPDRSSYVFFGSLLGILTLIGMYKCGGRARTVAKITTVVLLVGAILFCCNAVRADVFDTELAAMINVPSWGWRVFWDCATNLLMVVILLLVPA